MLRLGSPERPVRHLAGLDGADFLLESDRRRRAPCAGLDRLERSPAGADQELELHVDRLVEASERRSGIRAHHDPDSLLAQTPGVLLPHWNRHHALAKPHVGPRRLGLRRPEARRECRGRRDPLLRHGARQPVVEAPLTGRHLHPRMLDAVDARLHRAPHAVDAARVDRDPAARGAGDPHDLAELRHRELRLERVRALGHVAARAHDLDGVDPLLDELLGQARTPSTPRATPPRKWQCPPGG
jgi:hypothetical protein